MFRTRINATRVVGAAVAAVALATIALPSVASAAASTSSTGVVVHAGLNAPKDATVAVLEYLPAQITVKVGAAVTWSWKGAIEPHSVTFLAPGQQLPAPGSDPSLFGATPPIGPYDGQSFVNSGLIPSGPGTVKPFTMSFAHAGTFRYFCVIHPGMVGQVNVVESGKTDSKAAVAKRGAKESARWVKEGKTAQKQLLAGSKHSKANSEGTRTWTVQMGISTPHTDVLQFAPTPRKIHAGDHVTFVNNSTAPHTATFPGQQKPITDPTSPETDAPAPGPSPQTLDKTALYNTGLVPPNASAGPASPPPPKAARSYTYVVPAKGKYPYYCILHTLSGMGGTITAS
jgi:plastocyanin